MLKSAVCSCRPHCASLRNGIFDVWPSAVVFETKDRPKIGCLLLPRGLHSCWVLQVFRGAIVDRWWEAGEGNGAAWDAGWFRAEVTDIVDDLQDFPGLHAEIR